MKTVKAGRRVIWEYAWIPTIQSSAFSFFH